MFDENNQNNVNLIIVEALEINHGSLREKTEYGYSFDKIYNQVKKGDVASVRLSDIFQFIMDCLGYFIITR